MEQATAYPDAGLRTLCDSWVALDGAPLSPPASVHLRGGRLVGYLQVDHDHGFALRVVCETHRTPPGQWAQAHQMLEPWDNRYEQVKGHHLEPLSAKDHEALGLPAWPRGLTFICDPERARCRGIARLDPARELGNPDVVKAWVRSGGNPRAEQVRVRLDRKSFHGVYEGTLLVKPTRATQFSVGERVSVVEIELKGQWGLYCVWSLDRPAVECPPGSEQGTSDETQLPKRQHLAGPLPRDRVI